MSPRETILLPPVEAAPRPLPPWTLPVALLGLAVLAWTTVPAALRHRRLQREHEALERQARTQEETVRRLERDLEAVEHDRFLREHALRRLLHPGPPSR